MINLQEFIMRYGVPMTSPQQTEMMEQQSLQIYQQDPTEFNHFVGMVVDMLVRYSGKRFNVQVTYLGPGDYGRAYPLEQIIHISPIVMQFNKSFVAHIIAHEYGHVVYQTMYNKPSGEEWADDYGTEFLANHKSYFTIDEAIHAIMTWPPSPGKSMGGEHPEPRERAYQMFKKYHN